MTDGLNNKSQQLIDLLTANNSKLDQIITLLGGVPVATKTTDDLYEILTDIHTDTQSIDAKLLAIRNYIKDPSEDEIPGDFKSLLWNVYMLRRGTVIEDNSTNIWTLQAMLSYIGQLLSTELSAIKSYNLDTRNYLFNGLGNLGVSVSGSSDIYGGYLAISKELIALIQGAIGVPVDGLTYPDKGQRDIIQLLEKAASRPESEIGGGLLPPDVCTNAYISSGMALVPSLFQAWPPTIWAIWPSPTPTDIQFGTIFGIGVDNSELHPTSDSWIGWSIYVASSANNFGIYIGPDITATIARYPTNTWIDLSFLTTNLSVFVGGSDSLRVWLCGGAWGPGGGGGGPWGGGGGGGGPIGECSDVESVETSITHPNSSVTTIQMVSMSTVSGISSFGNTITAPTGGDFVSSNEDWTAELNANGWSVKLVGGATNDVQVYWQRSDLTFSSHTFTAVNEVFTIPENCARFTVDTFTGGPSTPFAVRICPPGITP